MAAGRDPDRIKVLFLAYPLVDTTMEAARDRRRLTAWRMPSSTWTCSSPACRASPASTSPNSTSTSRCPELPTNGHQSSLAKWIGKTPRRSRCDDHARSGIDFTGTPDHVAGMMQEIMEEVGGDGFLLFNGYFDRRYIMEVCDGLVPELQRRGLTRTAYAHKHFRDNLMEF